MAGGREEASLAWPGHQRPKADYVQVEEGQLGVEEWVKRKQEMGRSTWLAFMLANDSQKPLGGFEPKEVESPTSLEVAGQESHTDDDVVT